MAWLSWDKMCTPKELGGMGFRDLKAFNVALLAKQGWRLQTCTNSLFHRVFQAKYFPHGDFLSAELGTKPSYAWRSIMAAQQIIRKGSRWRIGNGAKVRIWGDRWLPLASTYKVVTPYPSNGVELPVASLINSQRGEWDLEALQRTLMAKDVESILSIALSPTMPDDCLTWALTTSGKFTVKSAYRLAIEVGARHNDAETSNSAGMKEFWKFIWRLKVPNKVRNFTWRACRNILPTKANLFRRRITEDNVCAVCGSSEETTGHVLWHCHRAKEVWRETSLDADKALDGCTEFLDVLWYVRNVKKWLEEDVNLLVMTAWGIWTNRNEVNHGKSHKPGPVLARWTKELLEEYTLANHATRPFKVSVDERWQPPKPPWYKTNMDGAVFTQQKEAGIGVVIRDHHGAVVAALSKKLKAPLGAIEAEAKAMEEAVTFAWEMGIRDCWFESDSLTVVNCMLRDYDPPSSITNIITGSLSQLYKFRDVHFSHVVRSGNMTAHTLAQFAVGVSDQIAWVEEIPDCVEKLVSQDVLF